MSIRPGEIDRILEVVPGAMVVVGAGGELVAANPDACALLGYESADLIGRPASILIADADRAGFEVLLQSSLTAADRKPETHSGFGRRASGAQFPLELNLRTANAGGSAVAFVGIRDASTLDASHGSFFQSQHTATLADLTRGIRHDFNNLLTVILCNCELLADDPLAEGSKTELVAGIKAAAKHAISLTRQLGSGRHTPAEVPVPTDLNGLVAEMEPTLARLVGPDIELTTRLAPQSPHVWADPAHLEHVLVTLAVHARNTMVSGGHIVIETGTPNRAGEEPSVHRNLARLAVVDDGPGVDNSLVAQAFDPLFSTGENGRSPGLGLFMVRNIVESYGGGVEFSSAVGEGTTIDVFLPCDPTTAGARREPAVILEGPTHARTALLVDGSDATRTTLRRLLEANGIAVIEAQSPLDAVALARNSTPTIDLLLIDTALTETEDLVETLRQSHPAVRVLFLSGDADPTVATHYRHLDAVEEKPIDPRRLVRRIDALLAGAPRPVDDSRPLIDRAATTDDP